MANSPFKIGDKEFSGVVITLENCLLPSDRLDTTPSVNDGLEHETEVDLRILGCEYIQTAGVLLRLPQTAMATGQVLFQRFFYSKSLVKHNMEIVAMACVYLASKIEEAPRRIRDTINVFHHIRQRRNNRQAQPLVLDQNYINTKNQVIKAERRVLKELGFCVHVKHPHKLIVMYLQVLDCEKNRKLVQTAWNFMNDSLRTDVFVRFSPETIACACIFLAARQLKVPLPNRAHCPCHWYELFGASEDEVQEISLMILKIYARDKKNYEDLDKEVEKRRKVLQEAKLRARGLLDEQGRPVDSTTGNSSPSSRPASPKNLSAKPSPVRDASSDKKVKREDGASSGSAHRRIEEVGIEVGLAAAEVDLGLPAGRPAARSAGPTRGTSEPSAGSGHTRTNGAEQDLPSPAVEAAVEVGPTVGLQIGTVGNTTTRRDRGTHLGLDQGRGIKQPNTAATLGIGMVDGGNSVTRVLKDSVRNTVHRFGSRTYLINQTELL
ncbi:Cyclin-L1 [Branchiostoma belcheri]|nr:Cyclin-L1 [Branchiostoma belcheri]